MSTVADNRKTSLSWMTCKLALSRLAGRLRTAKTQSLIRVVAHAAGHSGSFTKHNHPMMDEKETSYEEEDACMRLWVSEI